MTSPQTSPPAASRLRRRRIGEVLVERGVINERTLEDLLADQLDPTRPTRPRLGRLVVERGLATEQQVAAALAEALGLQLVDLTVAPVDPLVARALPRVQAERYGVLALRRQGDVLEVALTDPTNVLALDDVRLRTGARELALRVVTESQLADALSRIWSLAEDAGEVVTLLDALDEPADQDPGDLDSALDAAPVVRLVDALIADAVSQRASDVHVEPAPTGTRVRFRVDGLLREVMTVPRNAHPSLVSRLKILAGLDIAERRVPQDGRARLGVGGRQVEARVSTLPSMHGEKVVLRLLAQAADVPHTDAVGFTAEQRAVISEVMDQPQGLVLITGPTGSGKTSTLYALLREANRPERNIVTLEDPVEIAMPGITQVQVHPRRGLTFATGLRSVLRQDPDMVLVGEVRDSETAELALQASMTGHLVLTTLHTNDAVAALTRLVDMGVEPFLVASSLSLVAAQRLLRRPCPQCAAPYQPAGRTLALLGITEADLAEASPMRGGGCTSCGGTGYRGRVGVFEVLPVTAALRAVLLSTPTEGALAAAARAAGVVSLRAAALAAAARGETTYEEVLRVTAVGQLRGASGGRCRHCQRPMPAEVGDDAVCCPWCGTEREERACPECHRRTMAGWRTCPHCRCPLGEAQQTDLRVLSVAADQVTGTVRAALHGRAEVDPASTGAAALRMLAGTRYGAIVLDPRLPDMSAADLVRLLRADPATATLPVLAVPVAQPDADRGQLAGLGVIELPADPAGLGPAVLSAAGTAGNQPAGRG